MKVGSEYAQHLRPGLMQTFNVGRLALASRAVGSTWSRSVEKGTGFPEQCPSLNPASLPSAQGLLSGRRLKKTRKYDIITTPAERVEMAPLNEEDDEDEDSTVFDIKYRKQYI
ncbi:PREDICTED: membrane protein FAM174B [Miniopterus natalensis]|uniref:membrane protein FAM174B n=1 Tax=Miniopterus natalensis TaxID=291302 RepID=UPI0007A70A2B|nr:PREDICTED: membrane protein FAM174B [Miniopterus natalensis]